MSLKKSLSTLYKEAGMTGNSEFQPVDAHGWRGGLTNLLRLEFGKWWGSSLWWVQTLIWVVVINGILAPIVWSEDMPGEVEGRSMLPLSPSSPAGLFTISAGANCHQPGRPHETSSTAGLRPRRSHRGAPARPNIPARSRGCRTPGAQGYLRCRYQPSSRGRHLQTWTMVEVSCGAIRPRGGGDER